MKKRCRHEPDLFAPCDHWSFPASALMVLPRAQTNPVLFEVFMDHYQHSMSDFSQIKRFLGIEQLPSVYLIAVKNKKFFKIWGAQKECWNIVFHRFSADAPTNLSC